MATVLQSGSRQKEARRWVEWLNYMDFKGQEQCETFHKLCFIKGQICRFCPPIRGRIIPCVKDFTSPGTCLHVKYQEWTKQKRPGLLTRTFFYGFDPPFYMKE